MRVEGWSPDSAHLDARDVDTDLGVDKVQVDKGGSMNAGIGILRIPRGPIRDETDATLVINVQRRHQLPHRESRRRGVVKHRAIIRILCYERLERQ